MSASGWPKWTDMNWLRLLEGPGNLVILPVAPTMKRLIHKGERYFRMPGTRSSFRPDENGTDGLTEHGGAYLWDGYWTTHEVPPRRAGNVRAGECGDRERAAAEWADRMNSQVTSGGSGI